MSNRRTEESVRRAFGNAAPNNLKEVMGKCEEQKGRVIILENTAKKKSGRVFSRVMAAGSNNNWNILIRSQSQRSFHRSAGC